MALFIYKELERIKIKLIDIIIEYQSGNNDIILDILEKFKFNIKKLSSKLNYDCAETDLIICIIELIKKLDLNKLKNKSDGAIVNYINISLKNKVASIYKSKINSDNITVEFNDDIDSSSRCFDIDEIELKSLFGCLSKNQNKIMIKKYIHKSTDIEIASELGISRQSVYINNKKSIEKLKKII